MAATAKAGVESVAPRILAIRGHKVMVDADLAQLYGVATRVLNQAVRRNMERFPADFMFRLTRIEREQVVTACDHLDLTPEFSTVEE